MNSWSRMRKRLILALVILITAVMVGVPLYFLSYHAPTCSDAVKNGDETGVDCGGSCQKLCTVESLPLIVKGDPRVLHVASSTYEVVALLENANTSAEIRHARYTFKIYGGDSLIPLRTIEGDTYVPKGTTFAIFEGPFDFANAEVPTRATIEWDLASLLWEKNNTPEPGLTVENINFTRAQTSPRLEATVKSDSLNPVSNLELTALLYDESGSIFAASKTFLDTLSRDEEAPVIFTWPKPLASTPIEIKVLTRVLPDQSYLR